MKNVFIAKKRLVISISFALLFACYSRENILLNIAAIQWLNGDVKGANTSIDNVAASKSLLSHVYRHKANLLILADKPEEGLALFDISLQNHPDQPDLRIDAIGTAALLGKSDLALRYFSEQLNLPIPRNLAFYLLLSAIKRPAYLEQHRQQISGLLMQSFGLPENSPDSAVLLDLLQYSTYSDTTNIEASANFGRLLAPISLQALSDQWIPSALSVSELLHMSPDKILLGGDQVINGNFEQFDYRLRFPSKWAAGYWSANGNYSRSYYLVGIDTTGINKDNKVLRIDGLPAAHISEREESRAGSQLAPIILTPDTAYVISLIYRTASKVNMSPKPTIFLADQVDLLSKEIILPSTDLQWNRVAIVAWNRTDFQVSVTPLLRLWSTGTVWFDDFSIREIRRTDGQPIPPRDPIIDIRPAE